MEVDLGQDVTSVLMIIDGDSVQVGNPTVKGAVVKKKVLGE